VLLRTFPRVLGFTPAKDVRSELPRVAYGYPVDPWRSLRKANRRNEKRIYFRRQPGVAGNPFFRQATPWQGIQPPRYPASVSFS
jgi:hypothetical protein